METLAIGLIGPFISIATDLAFVSKTPILQFVYSHLGFTSNSQFLCAFGLILVCIFYVKGFFSFNVQRHVFKFGFGLQGDIQSRLMHAYLMAPYTFHLGRNTATLIQGILKDVEVFCGNIVMPALVSLSNVAVIAGLVVLLVSTSPLATVAISGILLIGYAIIHTFKDKMTRSGKEAGEASTEMIRIINHALGGLKEVRVIGCEPHFDQKMQIQARRFANTVSYSLSVSTLPRYVLEAFLMTFLILITFVFLASNNGSPQQLSSVLGIFAMASMRLMPAASNLMGAINGIRFANYAVDKIYFDLQELKTLELETPFEQPSLMGSASLNGHRQVLSFVDDIVLDSVVYRYPNVPEKALDGISLTIKRGQAIGLIGRSGAGKTTLVDVILGLLKPQDGDIRVDGRSIYKDLRSWQNILGYVPQSIFLMDDTLTKNIAFGVPDHLIDEQRLDEALKAAQLTELAEQLPDGMNTVLGERGVRLSGGQRQRIGIARALYHQRDILVLDEATAALDNETEKLVNEAIKFLSGTKTIIIIAHRLSTIEHCDCIYMLEKGHVVKSGSFQEVVSAQ